MEKILLDNRYKDKNYLCQVEDNKYKYEGSNNDYLRIGINEEHSLTFIDPPGGPFLSIGSKVSGIEGTISKIEEENNNIYITFK